MPDYNLGTAYGQIKIGFDELGPSRALTQFGAIVGAAAVVGQAVVQLSGLIGLVPAGVFAAGAAFAALKVGLSGFKEGLKSLQDGSLDKVADSAAKSAERSARSIRDAEKSVEDARKQAEITARDTFKSIESAKQNLADAEKSAADSIISSDKAVRDAEDNLRQVVVDSAKQQEAAKDRVDKAEQNLARTIRETAKSVENASRQVVAARKSEEKAQQTLNGLQQDAINLVDELAAKSKALSSDREDAAIALIDAQNNLARVNHDLVSTDLDRRKALQSVKKAQENLDSIERDQVKTTLDQGKAAFEVVNGNQAIADAKQQVVDANDNIARAEADLKQLQLDAVDKQIQAAKDLAGAKRDQTEGELRGLKNIQDARDRLASVEQAAATSLLDNQRKVREADQALTDARTKGAEASVSALDRIAQAELRLSDANKDARDSADQAAEAIAKQKKPFDDLSPSAQAAAATIKSLRGAYTNLKKTVQERLFAGASAEIIALTGIYLPVLAKGLGGIAGEFNFAAKEFSGFLRNGQNVSLIGQVFDLVRQILHNLFLSIRPLSDAFLLISVIGLQALRDLSGGAQATSEKFRDFIQRVAANGSLRAWIDRGIQGFKDLISIVGNVAGIFAAIFTGLGGGQQTSVLAFLKDATGALENFLKSAGAQQGLKDLAEFFKSKVRDGILIFKEAVKQLGPVFEKLGPILKSISEGFAPGAIATLQVLGPILAFIADILDRLSPVLGPVLGYFLGIGFVIGILGKVIGIFLPFLRILAGGFGIVFTIARILFTFLYANPFIALALAIVALVLLVIFNWDAIVKVITDALGSIGAVLEIARTAIIDWALDQLKNIGNFFRDFGGFFVDGFNGAIEGIQNFTGDSARNLEGWRDDRLRDVGNFFRDFGGFFVDGFNSAKEGIGNFLGDSGRNFQGWYGDRLTDQGNFLRDFGGFFVDGFNSAKEGIGNFINGAVGFFRDLPGKIFEALGNLTRDLFNIGTNIVRGLIDGIASAGQALYRFIVDFIKSFVPGPILDFLGIRSPSQLIREKVGRQIPPGISLGVEDAAPAMSRSIKETVLSAVGAAQSGLDAGFNFRTGIASSSSVVGGSISPGASGISGDIMIDNLHLHIAGNLDPTNPVKYRKAILSIRDSIRTVDRSRADASITG